jgi:hypothetical protein
LLNEWLRSNADDKYFHDLTNRESNIVHEFANWLDTRSPTLRAPVHAEPKCPSCVGMGIVDDEGFILKCFACDGTGILNRSAGG